MGLTHALRIKLQPLHWESLPTWHVLLQSGSAAQFLFCHSLISLQQCPARTFPCQLSRKFVPDQMILEVPSHLLLYDSIFR